MTTPNLTDFKAKFLADNPQIAAPLQALGLLGDALTSALDEMIEKAYHEHVEATKPQEQAKAPE
jgi:hypothetical protein